MNDNQTSHELKLLNRNILTLTGVKKIIKFDKREFVLDSIRGIITISGENLELLVLDTDNMNLKIKGIINGFNYVDKEKNKESFLVKLFK